MKVKTIVVSILLVGILLISAVGPASAAPKDTIRVWVSYKSGHKSEVAQSLRQVNAQFHYDFPELESYVVTLPASALRGITRNPFVVDVEEDPARYPIEPVKVSFEPGPYDMVDINGQIVPWGIDAVQAREVWDTDLNGTVDENAATGEGIKVCIIDTGFYAGHEDLKDLVYPDSGISQVDDNWSRDGAGHGSHVAGTISALNNLVGVVGVSPGSVDLFIVKIFADDGAWVTGASDLVAGIYACRDNGANIISMSLGGTSSNRKEQRAFDSLYSAGILHIAAAGNEQIETPGATSYPAGYSSVVSVAAVDPSLEVADFSLQNSDVEIAAPGVGVLSTVPFVETNLVTVDGATYLANHVEFSAYGSVNGELVDGGLCDSVGSWTGKVVLCQRGVNSFAEKILNAESGAAVAALIYNNEPGNFLGTMLDTTSQIIGLSLSQEDGLYLVTNKLGVSTNVFSELQKPASGYEAWDGTSMATPHVAGVAALVWSAHPNLTNSEIRNALNTTALDLGASGRDPVYGYGLAQAYDALEYLGGSQPPTDQPLTVTITSPLAGASYSNNKTVPISGKVTSNGTPVAGATITILISAPLNSTTITATSTSDGSYSASYRVSTRKSGTGTYNINVSAAKDGYINATSNTYFIVK